MSRSIVAADVLAAVDVLRQVNDTWDDYDAVGALELLAAVRALLVQAKAAESNLQSQALGQMESRPVVAAGKMYVKQRKRGRQYRHDEIHGAVATMARLDRNTGELTSDAEVAVRKAVALMAGLYVSPSVEPKSGGLKAVGYSRPFDAYDDTDKGWELVEVPDAG